MPGAPAFWLPDDRVLLLRSAFAPPDEARASWRAWRAGHDIEALDHPSFTLLPLVYKRLVELGEGDPQQPILKGLYKRTWSRNRLLQRQFFQTLDAFGRAAIPVLVIKGVAALRFYGGDPGVRPMMDADFLVALADVPRAIDTLLAEGWEPKPACAPDHMKTKIVPRHHG